MLLLAAALAAIGGAVGTPEGMATFVPPVRDPATDPAGEPCDYAVDIVYTCFVHHKAFDHDCLKLAETYTSCLDEEWTHVTDSDDFPRTPAAYNRVKNVRWGLALYNVFDVYIGRALKLYGEWSASEVSWSGIVR